MMSIPPKNAKRASESKAQKPDDIRESKNTKKKTGTKKQKTKQADEPKEIDTISKIEQIKIESLIYEALDRYKNEVLKQNTPHKAKELSHLASICEEYLSSFALIGYTLQNEEVVIFNIPSPKDESALVDLLRITFINIASNRQ